MIIHYEFHNLIENENGLSRNDVIIIGLVVSGLLLLTASGITIFCGGKKYMRYRRSKNYTQPYLYQLTISYLIDNHAERPETEPTIQEAEATEESSNNNADDVLPHLPTQAESSACNIISTYAKIL